MLNDNCDESRNALWDRKAWEYMEGTVALYISSLRKGGAERVMANLAEHLSGQGYRVVLVTTHKAEEEYPIKGKVCRLISEPEEEELKRGRIGNFLTRFQKLRNIWKRENPDVILSFIGKNNMMAILTSTGLKIPVAVSVRGEPREEYYNPGLRLLAKSLFGMASGIILQTKQSFFFFPRFIRKKAVILKNPVNPDFFRERFEGERDKTIVAVGRIDKNKNHKLLIGAFARIANEFPDYHLIIYGEGEKREELRRLTKDLNLEDRIHLPGNVDQVAAKIYKTRVFVLSSDTEGMPNTLVEAMILGLTVISTDCPCGGPAELIRHKVNGLLTPVGDEKALTENLRFVLENLHEADEMGKRAAITGEIYRPERVCQEWENYLISLGLGRNRR